MLGFNGRCATPQILQRSGYRCATTDMSSEAVDAGRGPASRTAAPQASKPSVELPLRPPVSTPQHDVSPQNRKRKRGDGPDAEYARPQLPKDLSCDAHVSWSNC